MVRKMEVLQLLIPEHYSEGFIAVYSCCSYAVLCVCLLNYNCTTAQLECSQDSYQYIHFVNIKEYMYVGGCNPSEISRWQQ